ncbi:hypothetical protein, partial [Streptomyces sp. Mg1]|uniref:hypothetical protein n=1 Tax=Streptomyces sp. Mg1 TaxID=465541 RepID=UPI00017E9B34
TIKKNCDTRDKEFNSGVTRFRVQRYDTLVYRTLASLITAKRKVGAAVPEFHRLLTRETGGPAPTEGTAPQLATAAALRT